MKHLAKDPTEQGSFIDFRKALSAFLSGFVLAKLDVLSKALSHKT